MGEKVMTKEEVIEEYGLCAVCADRRTCSDKDPHMVVSGCSSYVDDGCERYKDTNPRSARKGEGNDNS